MSEVPIGTALAYAGEVVDTGKAVIIEGDWLLCNGAPLSHKGNYEALFTAIGNRARQRVK